MKRSERDEWCAALRSGKYKQGKRRLKREMLGGGFKFCCLGVKAELDGSLRREVDPYDGEADWISSGSISVLSEDVLSASIQKELYEANDSTGLTFPQIADLIEKIVPVED